MKDIILLVMIIWSVSAIIMRRQVFEEDAKLWVTILRLILAPLLLIFGVIEWIVFGIKSTLRN